MAVYSYLVVRDIGFAPNPFGAYCTLATCKPTLRRHANVNDWIIGTSSIKGHKAKGKLVFVMKVDEKLTYNEYWNDQRFQYKRPVFNGSLIQCYGDNIYYEQDKKWSQLNSHHSLENGLCNEKNLKNDVKGKFVLISRQFYYFGSSLVEIPESFKSDICCKSRFPLYIQVPDPVADKFIDWITNNFQSGLRVKPYHLTNNFIRFIG